MQKLTLRDIEKDHNRHLLVSYSLDSTYVSPTTMDICSRAREVFRMKAYWYGYKSTGVSGTSRLKLATNLLNVATKRPRIQKNWIPWKKKLVKLRFLWNRIFLESSNQVCCLCESGYFDKLRRPGEGVISKKAYYYWNFLNLVFRLKVLRHSTWYY